MTHILSQSCIGQYISHFRATRSQLITFILAIKKLFGAVVGSDREWVKWLSPTNYVIFIDFCVGRQQRCSRVKCEKDKWLLNRCYPPSFSTGSLHSTHNVCSSSASFLSRAPSPPLFHSPQLHLAGFALFHSHHLSFAFLFSFSHFTFVSAQEKKEKRSIRAVCACVLCKIHPNPAPNTIRIHNWDNDNTLFSSFSVDCCCYWCVRPKR